MSQKRLLGMLLPVLLAATSALAQKNEMSLTAGASFVSTQTNLLETAQAPPGTSPDIHFGNEETLAFNYSRLLATRKIFGFSLEVPAAAYFRMDLNNYLNQVPKDIGAFFVTPSLRMNIFTRDSLTPWVSAGGGYGRFRYPHELNWSYGKYTGPGGSNTGVIQFGAGLDAWVWRKWGFRAEARDFWSGEPDLNGNSSLPVNTGRSRQHNYYVGVGVVTHW